MGIHEVLTAPQSPWQNSYVERLIGSIRRECLDHVIVLSEAGLRRVRKTYFDYSADRERTWHSATRSRPSGYSAASLRPSDRNPASRRAASSLFFAEIRIRPKMPTPAFSLL